MPLAITGSKIVALGIPNDCSTTDFAFAAAAAGDARSGASLVRAGAEDLDSRGRFGIAVGATAGDATSGAAGGDVEEGGLVAMAITAVAGDARSGAVVADAGPDGPVAMAITG
jgi:hypothetical protein